MVVETSALISWCQTIMGPFENCLRDNDHRGAVQSILKNYFRDGFHTINPLQYHEPESWLMAGCSPESLRCFVWYATCICRNERPIWSESEQGLIEAATKSAVRNYPNLPVPIYEDDAIFLILKPKLESYLDQPQFRRLVEPEETYLSLVLSMAEGDLETVICSVWDDTVSACYLGGLHSVRFLGESVWPEIERMDGYTSSFSREPKIRGIATVFSMIQKWGAQEPRAESSCAADKALAREMGDLLIEGSRKGWLIGQGGLLYGCYGINMVGMRLPFAAEIHEDATRSAIALAMVRYFKKYAMSYHRLRELIADQGIEQESMETTAFLSPEEVREVAVNYHKSFDKTWRVEQGGLF